MKLKRFSQIKRGSKEQGTNRLHSHISRTKRNIQLKQNKLNQEEMPSMKVVLMLSAIMLAICFVDNCAGNPYPSIGNKGKTKRLGNCAFLLFQCALVVKRSHVGNVLNIKKLLREKFKCLWNFCSHFCWFDKSLKNFKFVLNVLQLFVMFQLRDWSEILKKWISPQIFLVDMTSSVCVCETVRSARRCLEASLKDSCALIAVSSSRERSFQTARI